MIQYPIQFFGQSDAGFAANCSVPKEFEDQTTYLRHLVYEGAKQRYGMIDDTLRSRLDFELEVAFITCRETKLGSSISVKDVDDHIFGFVLFNDWSAFRL